MNENEKTPAPILDGKWLELVDLLQIQLAAALNSLGGQPTKGLHEHYSFYSAAHINRAVEGYVFLRKGGRLKSSVLLIRTAMEAMFRIQAVRIQPPLICQIAYTEFLEERKMITALPKEKKQELVEHLTAQWESFKQAYHSKYPGHKIVELKLHLPEVAETAKLREVYDVQYRLYCKHTHAALRAITGGFDNVSPVDSRTMALCAMVGIDALVSIGAVATDLPTISKEFAALDKIMFNEQAVL